MRIEQIIEILLFIPLCVLFITLLPWYHKRSHTFPIHQRIPFLVVLQHIGIVGSAITTFAFEYQTFQIPCIIEQTLVFGFFFLFLDCIVLRYLMLAAMSQNVRIVKDNKNETGRKRRASTSKNPEDIAVENEDRGFFSILWDETSKLPKRYLPILTLAVVLHTILVWVLFFAYFPALLSTSLNSEICGDGIRVYLYIYAAVFIVVDVGVLLFAHPRLTASYQTLRLKTELFGHIICLVWQFAFIVISIGLEWNTNYALFNILVFLAPAISFFAFSVARILRIAIHGARKAAQKLETKTTNQPGERGGSSYEEIARELISVIDDDDGFEMFMDFLKTEFSGENLLFLLFVEEFENDFRELTEEERTLRAIHICNQFIREDGDHPLNIPDGMRKSIMANFGQRAKPKKSVRKSIFQQAGDVIKVHHRRHSLKHHQSKHSDVPTSATPVNMSQDLNNKHSDVPTSPTPVNMSQDLANIQDIKEENAKAVEEKNPGSSGVIQNDDEPRRGPSRNLDDENAPRRAALKNKSRSFHHVQKASASKTNTESDFQESKQKPVVRHLVISRKGSKEELEVPNRRKGSKEDLGIPASPSRKPDIEAQDPPRIQISQLMFQPAKVEVFSLMCRDSFLRFRRQSKFREYFEKIQEKVAHVAPSRINEFLN